MGYDGWVTIGTSLDTKNLNKDIKDAENELRKYDKEAQDLTKQKVKIEIDLSEIEKQKEQMSAYYNEQLKSAQTEEQINFILQAEQIELQDILSKEQAINEARQSINDKLNTNIKRQSNINAQLEEMKKKLDQSKGFDSIKKSIDGVSNSLKRTVKQVGRWALAVFGIRSAYMAVRQAMSTLSQYDDQMATNIEYIRYAIANALKPVVEYILNLVVRILQVINSIMSSVFGINLFSKSSAEDFKKAKDNLGGANKEANKLKKTLAGFDEMNIIGDTDTGGGAGGGATLPPFDLSENVPLPKWMEELLKYKDEIIAAIIGIATALKLLELGIKPIQALGLGIAVAGLVYAIKGLLDYLKEPTWENFGKIIIGIGIAVAGLGVAFLGVPVAIAGILTAIIGLVISHWDEIKKFFQNGINWITSKFNGLGEKWGFWVKMFGDAFVNILQGTLNFFDKTFNGMRSILDNFINFFKNVFTGNWKGAWENLFNIANNVFGMINNAKDWLLNTLKNSFIMVFATVGEIASEIVKGTLNLVLSQIESKINNAINMFNGVLSTVNKLPGVNISKIGTVRLPRLAKGGIVNMPGRGVPVGGAIAGERGQEGVIPLTDAQQMSLLGEAIGRYITVNLTNINSMNGKVLSRELKTLQSESEFAFNR